MFEFLIVTHGTGIIACAVFSIIAAWLYADKKGEF